MKYHQKYFSLFNQKGNLINEFLVVANNKDIKGLIRLGNERVVDARLSDAQFFWEKNKSQNLVKQVSKLKTMNYFKGLGTYFDKVQRMRKLGGIISDELLISKEKVELSASICKVDLISDLVGEFPELQGVMGRYFALEQGFEEDIASAISDHYLPIRASSAVAKKPISIAMSLIDKIDVMVGFFGINEKPSSSKDPFALRRNAIGLLRTIIENKLKIQLKDLINYSIDTYQQQNVKFSNTRISYEILNFLKERFKNLLKDKNIRNDIIEAVDSSNTGYDFLILYKKCIIINKNISKLSCKIIIEAYKRAINIIEQETKNGKVDLMGKPESFLFKKDEEKDLYNKINDIHKYFTNFKKNENYEETLEILADVKLVSDNFFNNVIVNDENIDIKKNRLELLKMFCMTYNNFVDFSKLEGV
jgi:glycyl-tRNA synthetase beta chain